jgi:hypothetical protein
MITNSGGLACAEIPGGCRNAQSERGVAGAPARLSPDPRSLSCARLGIPVGSGRW